MSIIQFVPAELDVPARPVCELLAARQRERRMLWHLRRTVRDARKATFCFSVVRWWLDDVVDVVECDPDAWRLWQNCALKLRRHLQKEGEEIFLCEKSDCDAVVAALEEYTDALRDMSEFELREWRWQKVRAA